MWQGFADKDLQKRQTHLVFFKCFDQLLIRLQQRNLRAAMRLVLKLHSAPRDVQFFQNLRNHVSSNRCLYSSRSSTVTHSLKRTHLFHAHFFHGFVDDATDLVLEVVQVEFQQVCQICIIIHYKLDLRSNGRLQIIFLIWSVRRGFEVVVFQNRK